MRRLRRVVWRKVFGVTKKLGRAPEHLMWAEAEMLQQGLGFAVRRNRILAAAWARDRLNRRRYRHLAEAELRAARRSDTIFVFGCGASLNELDPAEWQGFARHDVLGVNSFYRERWIPVGFHILRDAIAGLRWRPYAEDVAARIASNPLYEETIFLIQEGFLAQHGNQLVGYGLLPRGARVARYRAFGGSGPPLLPLSKGLRARTGTVDAAVNFAYALGWRNIVLVGVDLYDLRYFWLPADQTIGVDEERGVMCGVTVDARRGRTPDDQHFTVVGGEIEVMREWREILAADGVSLSVYNPRSLLAEVLPVHPRLGGGERPRAAR